MRAVYVQRSITSSPRGQKKARKAVLSVTHCFVATSPSLPLVKGGVVQQPREKHTRRKMLLTTVDAKATYVPTETPSPPPP